MIFTSIEFAAFFIVVFITYWTVQRKIKVRNAVILAASFFFYGYWDPRFLFLIALSISIDFYCGMLIDKGKSEKNAGLQSLTFLALSALLFLVFPQLDFALKIIREHMFLSLSSVLLALFGVPLLFRYFANFEFSKRRKAFLIFSIFSNLTILGFFKYFNFFADSFAQLSESLFDITPTALTLDIILPVGISFYTFQTISYSVDIYRKELTHTNNIIDFGAFVSFFPQLVAGPIERGKNLLPQFQTVKQFPRGEQLSNALWLITWGIFKKVVVADNMAKIVDSTFHPFDIGNAGAGATDGLTLLVGVYAFSIQIYCDFSGYTDIARGIAKLFGFELMVNFKLPYFATDPSSFWRRWHISLSSWLRDYLYIPLGGNRGGSFFVYRNLSITMLLGGLWHGASWNFIIWGAYHGFLLSFYKACKLESPERVKISGKVILKVFIFFHLTCLGWLIFRAQNVETISHFMYYIVTSPTYSAITIENLSTVLFYSWFLVAFQCWQALSKSLTPVSKSHWFVSLNIWLFVLMSILVLASNKPSEFIYFAF
ncbi:MBOAT family O-acyltransferase [Alteromonas sp. W364]|uniref:MBOAT family O-acyltransferase n=1 Tax=Alteromonas sp. W364 TaxID=3075610 RepID=UPI002887E104|nr:MBOAT family O-acyltransferase [Alteromonas sp. W364]MDT0628975.1 MBOAT family O-acyltransferase [Alteromonas sp. W364]